MSRTKMAARLAGRSEKRPLRGLPAAHTKPGCHTGGGQLVGRADDKGRKSRRASTPFNWLEMVDARVAGLNETEFWREDSVLALQRCRLFLMVRFPHLLRPFSDEVLSRELSRGEERLCGLRHAKRVLRDLSGAQRKQLAGLVLDIELSLEAYARHGRNSKMVRELAATGDRRLRVL